MGGSPEADDYYRNNGGVFEAQPIKIITGPDTFTTSDKMAEITRGLAWADSKRL